jgi:thiol-disulfide isomerase/thioredoxin
MKNTPPLDQTPARASKTQLHRRHFAAALIGAGALPWVASTVAQTGTPSAPSTSLKPKDQSPLAPELTGLGQWFNTPSPLSMQALAGKVVLVNFWTFGCYNCVNTLPYVRQWHEQHSAKGLVIIGVHTPEFGFEKSADNVQAAITRFGIRYPVVQDNQFATWKAYNNRYWPAFYLVDQQGRIRYQHFGEGQYEAMNRNIGALLG